MAAGVVHEDALAWSPASPTLHRRSGDTRTLYPIASINYGVHRDGDHAGD